MLAKAVQNYGRYYTDNKSCLALTSEQGEKLFGSISPEDESITRLDPPKDGRRSYVMRSSGPRTVLVVSGWLELGEKLFRLDYAHDITDLISDQKSLATQIALWLSAGMLLSALGLYVLIKRALRPLAQLSTQAKAIAQGS
ncbi:hypothetical protein [Brevibacillus borstelensis]|uniref:hypothetical protein n=1 Tax=Brevibacillus borstelensis TaxID=45462 RepID=UPI0030C38502